MRHVQRLSRSFSLLILILSCCTPLPVDQTPPAITPTEVAPSAIIPDPAEIIFYNGNIITIEPEQPHAQALAIRAGVIQAVGSDEQVSAYQGADTVLIDLGGATLMPGFIDGHTHILAFPARMGRSLEEAQEIALQYGFTGLNEMWADQNQLDILMQAEREGKLRLRVSVFPIYNEGMLDDDGQKIVLKTWYPAHEPVLDPARYLRIPGIKIFVDGDNATWARGCWALTDPFPATSYALSHGICRSDRGDLYWAQSELNQVVAEAQAAGYRVAMHAMGDRAIETALNAIEFALDGESNEIYRHQVQHNSLIDPDVLPRYTELDILASVRGHVEVCDLDDFLPEFGLERYAWYINRFALPGMGVHAYVETDYGWTVDPGERYSQRTLDPIMHIFGLVTHQYASAPDTICEPDPLLADYHISVERALEMLTIEPAYAVSMEGSMGSLKPGKFADIIILSGDPLSIEPDELLDLRVLMTMVAGRVEYCAEGADEFCPAAGTTGETVPASPTTAPVLLPVDFDCDSNPGSPLAIASGIYLQTTIRWAAATAEQVHDYLENVLPAVLVDGVPIETRDDHGEVSPMEGRDLFLTTSFFDVGILEPGQHVIQTILSFSYMITDGFGNYGPGTETPTVEGTCTVNVE